MRTLALWGLLLVLPFGGIRVMCFESSIGEGRPATAAEAMSDCERMCPLHPPEDAASEHPAAVTSEAAASDTEPGCALSSDASTLTALGSIAVLRAEQPLHVPAGVSIAGVDSPRFYVAPSLADPAPPPKSPAL